MLVPETAGDSGSAISLKGMGEIIQGRNWKKIRCVVICCCCSARPARAGGVHQWQQHDWREGARSDPAGQQPQTVLKLNITWLHSDDHCQLSINSLTGTEHCIAVFWQFSGFLRLTIPNWESARVTWQLEVAPVFEEVGHSDLLGSCSWQNNNPPNTGTISGIYTIMQLWYLCN